MQNRKTLLAAALVAVFGLAAIAGSAQAETVSQFKGSRDQVRSACAKVGGSLIEGSATTSCINKNNNTSVMCGDLGNCVGITPLTSAVETNGPLGTLGFKATGR